MFKMKIEGKFSLADGRTILAGKSNSIVIPPRVSLAIDGSVVLELKVHPEFLSTPQEYGRIAVSTLDQFELSAEDIMRKDCVLFSQ